MNIQALMKQAQTLQKDMMKTKEEIDNMTFTGTSSFISVTVKGNKEVAKVTIDNDDITSDDKEMIEDMLVVALNDAFKQIDKVTEQKMGKYSSMMPGGLF
jgi:DNA-binding protein, ybaB/ebfC family